MINIAVNGFGRIGRNFVRVLLQDKEACKKITLAAINIGPGDISMMAHLFKYDTIMGTYPGSVSIKNSTLVIDNHEIALIAQRDPAAIDWKKYSIDWVVESSGKFTQRDQAELHIKAGAKHVLITAPAKGDDATIIPGVNLTSYNAANDRIVSLGSCTTNAFIPMLKVLHEHFGILNGFMTTVHAYTNSQVLLDVEGEDMRRSRAAALNIIPTTTGASSMIAKLMPELTGKIDALSIRVPVAKVSLIDITFKAQKPVTKELINAAFITASKSAAMKGIIDLSTLPLVSSDYAGNPFSVVIDGELTMAQGDMAKAFGWYDNEWAYSLRLKNFLEYVAK